jgi:hypothetical protein
MAAWRNINWTLQPHPCSVDVPVWTSVQKLEQSWKVNIEEYIGKGGFGNAIDNRYKQIGDWLRSESMIWMPAISFDDSGTPAFTDGRHRFAWIRDHQADTLQIAVPPDQVLEFKRRFGTEVTISKWFDKNV